MNRLCCSTIGYCPLSDFFTGTGTTHTHQVQHQDNDNKKKTKQDLILLLTDHDKESHCILSKCACLSCLNIQWPIRKMLLCLNCLYVRLGVGDVGFTGGIMVRYRSYVLCPGKLKYKGVNISYRLGYRNFRGSCAIWQTML